MEVFPPRFVTLDENGRVKNKSFLKNYNSPIIKSKANIQTAKNSIFSEDNLLNNINNSLLNSEIPSNFNSNVNSLYLTPNKLATSKELKETNNKKRTLNFNNPMTMNKYFDEENKNSTDINVSKLISTNKIRGFSMNSKASNSNVQSQNFSVGSNTEKMELKLLLPTHLNPKFKKAFLNHVDIINQYNPNHSNKGSKKHTESLFIRKISEKGSPGETISGDKEDNSLKNSKNKEYSTINNQKQNINNNNLKHNENGKELTIENNSSSNNNNNNLNKNNSNINKNIRENNINVATNINNINAKSPSNTERKTISTMKTIKFKYSIPDKASISKKIKNTKSFIKTLEKKMTLEKKKSSQNFHFNKNNYNKNNILSLYSTINSNNKTVNILVDKVVSFKMSQTKIMSNGNLFNKSNYKKREKSNESSNYKENRDKYLTSASGFEYLKTADTSNKAICIKNRKNFGKNYSNNNKNTQNTQNAQINQNSQNNPSSIFQNINFYKNRRFTILENDKNYINPNIDNAFAKNECKLKKLSTYSNDDVIGNLGNYKKSAMLKTEYDKSLERKSREIEYKAKKYIFDSLKPKKPTCSNNNNSNKKCKREASDSNTCIAQMNNSLKNITNNKLVTLTNKSLFNVNNSIEENKDKEFSHNSSILSEKDNNNNIEAGTAGAIPSHAQTRNEIREDNINNNNNNACNNKELNRKQRLNFNQRRIPEPLNKILNDNHLMKYNVKKELRLINNKNFFTTVDNYYGATVSSDFKLKAYNKNLMNLIYTKSLETTVKTDPYKTYLDTIVINRKNKFNLDYFY